MAGVSLTLSLGMSYTKFSLLLLLLAYQSHSFYLPGVAPQDFITVSRLFELFLAYEKDPNVKLLLLKENMLGLQVQGWMVLKCSCGLATHLVSSAKLPLLEEALVNLDSSDPARISAIIDEYSERPYLKGKSAYHGRRKL